MIKDTTLITVRCENNFYDLFLYQEPKVCYLNAINDQD